MKKPVIKNIRRIEPPSISVNAFLQEPRTLKNLVEKLASENNDIAISDDGPGEWQTIGLSSLEGYALGDLILSDENDRIKLLFDTCFLFTCTMEKSGEYDLTWSSSLS